MIEYPRHPSGAATFMWNDSGSASSTSSRTRRAQATASAYESAKRGRSDGAAQPSPSRIQMMCDWVTPSLKGCPLQVVGGGGGGVGGRVMVPVYAPGFHTQWSNLHSIPLCWQGWSG